MRNAVIIDGRDNVVVAIYPLKAGDEVTYPLPSGGEGHLTTSQNIPLFHKIARSDIRRGELVVKYGEFIGQATCDIGQGDHVHTQNCASTDDLKDSQEASGRE